MRGNAYLSRPVGSNEPPTHRRPQRVAVKEVFIGNHKPTDHFAPAAKVFIHAEDLYVPRSRQRR